MVMSDATIASWEIQVRFGLMWWGDLSLILME